MLELASGEIAAAEKPVNRSGWHGESHSIDRDAIAEGASQPASFDGELVRRWLRTARQDVSDAPANTRQLAAHDAMFVLLNRPPLRE